MISWFPRAGQCNILGRIKCYLPSFTYSSPHVPLCLTAETVCHPCHSDITAGARIQTRDDSKLEKCLFVATLAKLGGWVFTVWYVATICGLGWSLWFWAHPCLLFLFSKKSTHSIHELCYTVNITKKLPQGLCQPVIKKDKYSLYDS